MTSPIHIEAYGCTDVGCIRTSNEDCYLFQTMDAPQSELNQSELLNVKNNQDLFAAVSDGMGGAAAGEVASQTALTTYNEYLQKHNAELKDAMPNQIVQILEEGIQIANRAILKKADELKSHKGMGATITALYLKKDIMYLLQVGDSRAYVYRDKQLVRITRDQSFVGHLVEMGTITEAQALKHPQRNVILQALGTQDHLKVDISYLPLCKGDLVIICSDGLYSEFLPEQLELRVRDLSPEDIKAFVKSIIDDAKKAGGKDNITALALYMREGLPAREPGEVPRYQAFPYLDQDNPLNKAQSLFQ